MRLKDKVAIVTGGANGIGRAIAHCMAKEGAHIVIADKDVINANIVAGEIINLLGSIGVAIGTDVTSDYSVHQMVHSALVAFGKIDILVNNAGVSGHPTSPLSWQEEGDWDLVHEVNVKGTWRTVRAIAPHFVERRRGRIINISSIAGFMPGPMKPAYSASKLAVAELTMLQALEFAKYTDPNDPTSGITANAIAPGLLWTGLWERLAADLKASRAESADKSPREIFEKRVRELVPMGREQMPEDIGWTAVFFASDEARNITGQVLFVDGGVVMRP